MERVVKRYFMHNQGDLDDPKQNEFDDLKSELQTMRYEMISDMKKSKEDNARNMYIVNGSIQFIAEEIMINYKNDYDDHQSLLRYKELINAHQYLLASFNALSNIALPSAPDHVFANNSELNSPMDATGAPTNNSNDFSLNRKRNSATPLTEPPLNESSNFINNNFSKNSVTSKVSFDLFDSKGLQTIAEESNSQFTSISK